MAGWPCRTRRDSGSSWTGRRCGALRSMNDIRRALLDADPGLSRFDPLPRIISYDDFSRGFGGWTQLVGNYEGSLDTMSPSNAQHTPPQLSTLPIWDFGSHDGMHGSY